MIGEDLSVQDTYIYNHKTPQTSQTESNKQKRQDVYLDGVHPEIAGTVDEAIPHLSRTPTSYQDALGTIRQRLKHSQKCYSFVMSKVAASLRHERYFQNQKPFAAWAGSGGVSRVVVMACIG